VVSGQGGRPSYENARQAQTAGTCPLTLSLSLLALASSNGIIVEGRIDSRRGSAALYYVVSG
jgi:hypothetical protein